MKIKKSTPLWVKWMHEGIRYDTMAKHMREASDALRCPTRDSGGARCTRDRHPQDDDHTIDRELLS